MTVKQKRYKSAGYLKSVAVLVILAGLAGGGWYAKSSGLIGGEKKEVVQTAPVAKGSIEEVVTAQGTLEPKEYVDVGAQVSGQLEKLYVEIGQEVKKGDLLAEIDAEIYETQVQGEEANLKTLKAQKAEQEAKVTQAKQKSARNKKLFDTHAVSQETYQDAQTDLAVAQAQLNSIDAQIEQAEYTLKGNKTNLNYTKIYAPMDGTVTTQTAREGETLNASQTTPAIVQLGDLDTMTVKAEVAEADIVKIKPGMDIYFTILGSQDRKWDGKVRQIYPTPETENDVVLYNVLVDVDNKDRQLMSGMSTQMFFVIGSAKDVMTIPTRALTQRLSDEDKDGRTAYQVNVFKNGMAEQRTVFVGLQDRTKAEITEGLSEGEQVMLSAPPVGETSTQTNQPRGMRGMARL